MIVKALRTLSSGTNLYSAAMLSLLFPVVGFSYFTNFTSASYFSDICFFLYSVIALIYFGRATYMAHRFRPALVKAWLLLTMSALCIVCTIILWIYTEIILGKWADDTTGISFLILSHLLFGAGVYSLPQYFASPFRSMRQLIDLLIIMIASSILLWAFWIYPSLQEPEPNIGSILTMTLYLLSDLVLVAALGSIFFRRHLVQRTKPLLLLTFSIVVMLVADGLLIWGSAYQPGDWSDHLNLFALVFGTLSAKMQIDTVQEAPAERERALNTKWLENALGMMRSLLPPFLLFISFITMIFTHDNESYFSFYIMASGVGLMFILVSVHLAFILKENVGLTTALRAELHERRQAQTELQEVNVTLEQHVAERTRELLAVNEQLRENERKLRFDAFHDKLTGLPNRTALIHHVEGALQAYQTDPSYRFAVLFLDFDSFKVVNDSLGHWLGDEFLIALARRIKERIPIGNLAARLGGDEFVVLVENIFNLQEVIEIAEQLQLALRQPYEVRGYRLYTSASIGIVMNEEFHQTAGDLLRDADIAMYQAKENGKARCVVFDAKMRAQAIARLKLETSLRNALNSNGLQVAYQPIWNVETKSITGFEALARWHHKDHGMVSPAEFIPVAEETGLITPLGEWVLEEACRQLRQWQIRFPGTSHLTVSVNLSAHQLYQGDIIRVVKRILQKTGLAERSLKLEITESVFMEDIEAAIATCSQLRDLGVCLQIDDFGTGYSSFNYLHRLPINTMKIDKSFIDLIHNGDQHVEIVRTIATLAQSLQLSVIAEGVETQEQLDYIEALGCEQVQGYLISKPLEQDDAEAFIAASITANRSVPVHKHLLEHLDSYAAVSVPAF